MKITTVRFRKLITGPNYSNTAVEAEAVVDDGETAEDALLSLSAWVRAQLGETGLLTTDPDTLRDELRFLHGQRQQLRVAIATAEAEKKNLQEDIKNLEVARERAGGEPVMPF